jgi:hypothetical protein
MIKEANPSLFVIFRRQEKDRRRTGGVKKDSIVI